MKAHVCATALGPRRPLCRTTPKPLWGFRTPRTTALWGPGAPRPPTFIVQQGASPPLDGACGVSEPLDPTEQASV
eukprot:3192016-Alexandrium_andersonii.AAC.1